MQASVVIRSKDEAGRLRLTLASLARQTVPAEIIVVNDGSRDHTAAVVAAAPLPCPVIYVEHGQAQGRSAASNAGAARASGDVLIFLDGDTLAAPDLVERHLQCHRQHTDAIIRGETRHLRCTRYLADPETGLPMPGEASRIARLPPYELARMRITQADILHNFDGILARSLEGIYPGTGPRKLYELEMDALQNHPGCNVLWAAAAGANLSVTTAIFRATGGFDRALTINEHRELALRLCQAGGRMLPLAGACSFHMTHRAGWRDPLVEAGWEQIFYQKHPIAAVALLAVLWRSLAQPPQLPVAARIESLPALEAAALRCAGIYGIEAIRNAHLQFHIMADAS
ncbi:MAG: glycosyltransferase [Acidocella sp.]|nr:glycosyltransferase [Acidocella sp.]